MLRCYNANFKKKKTNLMILEEQLGSFKKDKKSPKRFFSPKRQKIKF